ncbi:MAG: hypothetical protein [Wigfec virus K19_170]|nr:MAG: hypothetical protein [Wigfec virus K19_170]
MYAILYLVFDSQKQTLSTPLLAPTLEIAQQSLNSLNPENLSSLSIHQLAILNSPLDLFLLSIDETKTLPSNITGDAGHAPQALPSECAVSL